jgi:hypothetical protein
MTEPITKKKYRAPDGAKCAFCTKPAIHKIGRFCTCSDKFCKYYAWERFEEKDQ